MAGLQSLRRVGGSLNLSGNESLDDLSVLAEATFESGDLTVIGNGSLSSLAGLEGMQVRNFVTVTDNPALERLEGLDQLERAGDSVLVSTNPELVSAELPGDLRLATSRAGARIIDTGNLVFARLATRSFAQAGRAPRLSWGILSPGLAYDALEPSHVDHP